MSTTNTLTNRTHPSGQRHGIGNYERALFKEGKATYIPNNLHMAATDRIQTKKVNIYCGSATPMDSKGYMSLSLGNVMKKIC